MPLEKATMIFSSASAVAKKRNLSAHNNGGGWATLLDTVLTEPIRKHGKPKALLSDLTDDTAEEILMD